MLGSKLEPGGRLSDQNRLVGGEDRHVGVGITVDLTGDLGQGVAGLDSVEAGLNLFRAGWRLWR
jgi:hypothetical protein